MSDTWKWSSALAPWSPWLTSRDKGDEIFYCVLFTKKEEIDDVWPHVGELTEQGSLGNRAAVSPDTMKYGHHRDHYTIVVEYPEELSTEIGERLWEHGLEQYVYDYRVRKRFGTW